MADQFYLEISIDLFDQTSTTPRLQIRSLDHLKKTEICTCNEIHIRQGRCLKWDQRFTLRIACWNMKNPDLSTVYRLTQSITGPLDLVQHRKLMFELKDLCACDTQPEECRPSNVNYEWALLDLGEDGNLFRNPDFGSFSSEFDESLRRTPLVRHLDKFKNPKQVRQRINYETTKVLKAKLASGSSDNEPGYVYIMQTDESSKHVKIGYSRKHPAIRHDSLKNCFKDLRIVAHTNRIPHASKVERLVHAELAYYRRQIDCEKCAKQHTEWFEVSAGIAERAILRWSRWLASRPYERFGGQLKQTWQDRLVHKNVENVAVCVNHYLKKHLNEPAISVQHENGAELSNTERIRKRIHSVRMINVENESSHLQLPTESESDY